MPLYHIYIARPEKVNRINGLLNSGSYIYDVLRPVALPFIRIVQNAAILEDDARPHVSGIARTFLYTKKKFGRCPGLHVLQIC